MLDVWREKTLYVVKIGFRQMIACGELKIGELKIENFP